MKTRTVSARRRGWSGALLVVAVACGGGGGEATRDESSRAEDPTPTPRTLEVPAAPTRPGPLCSYHGWCWERPAPAGNDLDGVWVGEGRVVSVGARGTVLVREDGSWRLEDPPSRAGLHAVWGPSFDDLWVAGDDGAVWHRTSGGWQSVATPTTATLRSMVGRTSNEFWVGGDGGVVIRREGDGWVEEPTGAAGMITAMSLEQDSVYALAVTPAAEGVAPSTALLVRTADGWSERATLAADAPALAVAGEGEVLIGGREITSHPSGGRARGTPRRMRRPIEALHVRGNGMVLAVGYEGAGAVREDGQWRTLAADGTSDFRAIAGDDTAVWAVGRDGRIARWTSDGWADEQANGAPHLWAVWGSGDDDIWAVGSRVMLHFDGATWRPEGTDDFELRAVHGRGRTVLAAGRDGATLRLEAGAWRVENVGLRASLEDVWVGGPEDAVLVGKAGGARRETGRWVSDEGLTGAVGVWGSATDDVWVATNQGLQHWDGQRWEAVIETSGEVLFDVWGSSPEDVWAVGAAGVVWHRSAGGWARVEVPTASTLMGVWGSGPEDVWAVGHHGTVLHWDGERWRWRDSGTDVVLHSVWGTGSTAVWAVGHGGTILRFRPPTNARPNETTDDDR